MAGDTRRPHPGAIGRWIAALRPPTLLASATSILSGASATSQHLHWGWLGITFLGLGTLQIAANLINDYGDYKKGADGAGRLGPPRVISMGWISPQEIRRAIDYALCIELLFAIPLCFRGGLKVFMLGIVGVCGAVWYTSGSYSLAYYGLGEVAVFLLFGPGSVMGTVLVQTGGTLSVQQVLVPSIMAGLLVSAILVVNNLRDIPTDLKAGKLTIATRIGEDYTRGMYTVMVAAPYLMIRAKGLEILSPHLTRRPYSYPHALLPRRKSTESVSGRYGLLGISF
ncbi:hypothetical protein AAMO2058_001107600 [Amorphochlora amoebiformis]